MTEQIVNSTALLNGHWKYYSYIGKGEHQGNWRVTNDKNTAALWILRGYIVSPMEETLDE